MTTYVERKGGLGNQLFQLAAAMSLDKAGDGRLLPGWPSMQLSIEELAPGLLPPIRRRDRWVLGRPFPRPNTWQRVVQRGLRVIRRRVERRTISQKLSHLSVAFAAREDSLPRPKLLSGYFQHPDWFTESLPRLVESLLAAAPDGLAVDVQGPTVVCVRGGDYVSLGWALSDTYYVAATGEFAPRSVRVVTDDAARGQEVADLLTTAGWVVEPFRAGANAVDDFWTIVAAPSVIMANSTFNWWAVVVGDELHRRLGNSRSVVAPASWINGHGTALLRTTWRAVG
ncbi:MAG: hypothetical protein WCK21_04605 [Actinomycetota bacterium]